jgi:hypothetical protein
MVNACESRTTIRPFPFKTINRVASSHDCGIIDIPIPVPAAVLPNNQRRQFILTNERNLSLFHKKFMKLFDQFGHRSNFKVNCRHSVKISSTASTYNYFQLPFRFVFDSLLRRLFFSLSLSSLLRNRKVIDFLIEGDVNLRKL